MKFPSFDQFILILYTIWSFRWQTVTLNPVVSIDCDCSQTIFETNSASVCCITNLPDIDASTQLTFSHLANGSHSNTIAHLNLHTLNNFSDIPSQIIETFRNLEHLELSIGVERLPLNRLPSKLKHLNLSKNRITSIDIDAFRDAAGELEQVNAQYNRIERIAENGAFNGLVKLHTLILYHNKLTTLKKGIFSGAPNIENLDLAFNEIATIEDGVFDLLHLKEILISDNKLKCLSDNIFHNSPNVQNVDLQKNHLERIGKAFELTMHLHQLQLSDNHHLENIDIFALSNLPELISLSVDGIGMRALSSSASIPNSSNSPLHTLSLSQNHLTSTDFLRQLSIFSKLEKLFVDANKFTRWDDADIRNIRKYFPHIELIVTKNNVWDRRWVESTLIPVFQANSIYCSNVKYLNTYIEGFTNSIDGQIIEGTECI